MKPIIFNTEMIRAILDDRKTQTRRVITRMNSNVNGGGRVSKEYWEYYNFDDSFVDPGPSPAGNSGPYLKVFHKEIEARDRIYPLLFPGDKLWVKETWALQADLDTQLKEDGLTPGQIINEGYHIGYKADGSEVYPKAKLGKFRSPRFMPKWASRITLEIKNVRVERVQKISAWDCTWEGLGPGTDIVRRFKTLWNSINEKRGYGWDTNCYVWILEFEKI